MVAVQNEALNEHTLELILERARAQGAAINVNYRQRSRTTKWKLIDKGFRSVVRLGISKSDLAMNMAHTEGSTALHWAAAGVSLIAGVCAHCVS